MTYGGGERKAIHDMLCNYVIWSLSEREEHIQFLCDVTFRNESRGKRVSEEEKKQIRNTNELLTFTQICMQNLIKFIHYNINKILKKD